MLQKQSQRPFLANSLLEGLCRISDDLKRAKIRAFIDRIFPYKENILPLYWRIGVSENPYSRIFYAVLDKLV